MGLLDGLFGTKKKDSKASTTNTSKASRKSSASTMAATQIHLKFGEIRDNILVLKNGGVRAVLKATSINFNLKSEEERNAITMSYQGFINSLEFPVQIMVRSKKLDIDNYIEKIKKMGEKQENKLLKDQTIEYADFVKKLVEYTDIMQKEFYVVIPYNPVRARNVPLFQKFFQNLRPKDSYAEIKKRHKEFANLKKQLAQRLNIVESGLANCGIKTDQLTTEQIIELLYNTYNPQISRTEKVKNVSDFTIQTDEESKEEEESEVK
ncbi:hypothetical protein HOG17_04015 [Candidatus Peregrinibacteria bacterium]|jgi:hypothetical protein|nr:hypothetical protein [Candidatus Peregrinibacteria bacterium]MBT4366665.1 hypothetical protein [Candidatus Peregrinibacteria bacterium]MBT4455879.1 hypothetical protein [Candidatus Peregrinibacteria bacterium]